MSGERRGKLASDFVKATVGERLVGGKSADACPVPSPVFGAFLVESGLCPRLDAEGAEVK